MNYELGEFNLIILKRIILSKALLFCVFGLIFLKIISVGVFINLPFNIFFSDISKIALESMANQTRQALGISTLKSSAKLEAAAKLKAEDMIKNQYFSHTSPAGTTPWFWFLKTGYDYKYAGENLAIGFFDSKEVYDAWFDSPSHRENILNPNYKEVGTAIAQGYGPENAIIVVQLFGSEKAVSDPVAAKQPVAAAEKKETSQEKNLEPKVLAQSIASEISQGQPVENPGFMATISNYIFNLSKVLNEIIFGIGLLLIACLICLIYAQLGSGQFFPAPSKPLFLRSALIIALLLFSSIINKELVTSIIPHQFLIN